MNVDDGLEDIRRIRGLGGEKLPAASYALLPNLKKGLPGIFCHRRGIEKFCRLFSIQQRPNVFVSDAWPAPATYHRSFVNTVTRGWVGAPNGRARFRFHGAVVGFVDRCLSRTRNLAASNKHLAEFFSGRSWPKSGPGIIFFGVSEKFETFFSNICAHSKRYRNLLAGIFEILTFYGNIAFPLSPVYKAVVTLVHTTTNMIGRIMVYSS